MTAEARGRARSKCLNRVTGVSTEPSPPCRALEESSQPTKRGCFSPQLVRTFRELAVCHPPRPGVSCCPGHGLPRRATVCPSPGRRCSSLRAPPGLPPPSACGLNGAHVPVDFVASAWLLVRPLGSVVQCLSSGCSHASAVFSGCCPRNAHLTPHTSRDRPSLPEGSARGFGPSVVLDSFPSPLRSFFSCGSRRWGTAQRAARGPASPAAILLILSRACPPAQQWHLLCHNGTFSDPSRERADHAAVTPRPRPGGPAPAASPGLESAVSSRCLPSCQHVSRLFKAGPDVLGNTDGGGPPVQELEVPKALWCPGSASATGSGCSRAARGCLPQPLHQEPAPELRRPTGTWRSCEAGERPVTSLLTARCSLDRSPSQMGVWAGEMPSPGDTRPDRLLTVYSQTLLRRAHSCPAEWVGIYRSKPPQGSAQDSGTQVPA